VVFKIPSSMGIIKYEYSVSLIEKITHWNCDVDFLLQIN
jgi:hypothetical protein